jgi:hypothetical protein
MSWHRSLSLMVSSIWVKMTSPRSTLPKWLTKILVMVLTHSSATYNESSVRPSTVDEWCHKRRYIVCKAFHNGRVMPQKKVHLSGVSGIKSFMATVYTKYSLHLM